MQTDDSALTSATGFAARLNKEMERERARYQKDLQDFERTVHQTRTKYQGKLRSRWPFHYAMLIYFDATAELAQLTEDLGSQRDDMLRYKEANRLLKAKEEELRRELEDELHSSSGWKREKERLESRIGMHTLRWAVSHRITIIDRVTFLSSRLEYGTRSSILKLRGQPGRARKACCPDERTQTEARRKRDVSHMLP